MRRTTGKGGGVLLVLAAILVIVVLTVIILMNVFVVRNVIVMDPSGMDEQEVVRMSQIRFGGLIHRVNEDQIRSSLESSGKYALDGVSVHYPNTIILDVRLRTRDAVVLNGGQYLTIDTDACVVEMSQTLPQDGGIYVYNLDNTFFELGGRLTAPQKKLDALIAVLKAVRTQGAVGYLSDLDMADPKNMWATTRTGIRVSLGSLENMNEKILWLRSAVSDLEMRGQTRGTLDISSGTKADYRP